MNPNWSGISCAILAFAAFFVVYRAAAKLSIRCRVFLTMVALLAAVPGASFAVYYLHVFPEREWYYEFRSIVGIEILLVFVGAAGGMVATLLPRWLRVVPLAGVWVCLMLPLIKPFIGTLGELDDEWKGGVCLQSTPSTCGPAATATVLSDLGGNTGEAELARAAHSYAGGTEAWHLARAVRVRGYEARFDFTEGFSPDGGLPAVVGVRLAGAGHFIAVLGREGGKFVVGDPLQGRELLSPEEMRRRYVFTGFHMRIRNKDAAGGNS